MQRGRDVSKSSPSLWYAYSVADSRIPVVDLKNVLKSIGDPGLGREGRAPLRIRVSGLLAKGERMF